VKRGEALIAGTNLIAPLAFEMAEKAGHAFKGDMFKREACNPASSIACGEDQEEPQGVAIAFD